MRLKGFVLSLSILALLWAARPASAGVVRTTGKVVGQGSVAVAQTTASAAGTAADGVATVGKQTPGAVMSGAAVAGKEASVAPRLAYRGTKSAAKGIWKALW